MAGYTAANNLLGFLYVSVNSITQACMSFTSQNYGVGKLKRMDRVLADCMILSVVVAVVLGCICYGFGPEILQIYTEDAEVIACGMEILHTTITYFLCGWMDLFRGRCAAWDIPRCRWCCRSSERLVREWCGFLAFFHTTDHWRFCLYLIQRRGLSRLSCR